MSYDYDLTLEAAIKEIEAAFKPLKCVVEVFDHEQKIRWRVFDGDGKPLLTMKAAMVWEVRNSNLLDPIVSACRTKLEQQGYKSNL